MDKELLEIERRDLEPIEAAKLYARAGWEIPWETMEKLAGKGVLQLPCEAFPKAEVVSEIRYLEIPKSRTSKYYQLDPITVEELSLRGILENYRKLMERDFRIKHYEPAHNQSLHKRIDLGEEEQLSTWLRIREKIPEVGLNLWWDMDKKKYWKDLQKEELVDIPERKVRYLIFRWMGISLEEELLKYEDKLSLKREARLKRIKDAYRNTPGIMTVNQGA